LEERRVEMVVLGARWTSSGAAAGERVSRIRLSDDERRGGRATWAIILVGGNGVSVAHLSVIATPSCH
jgi:hypothetical protein